MFAETKSVIIRIKGLLVAVNSEKGHVDVIASSSLVYTTKKKYIDDISLLNDENDLMSNNIGFYYE